MNTTALKLRIKAHKNVSQIATAAGLPRSTIQRFLKREDQAILSTTLQKLETALDALESIKAKKEKQ